MSKPRRSHNAQPSAPTEPASHALGALDAAFHHARIGFAIGTADGCLRDVNPAFAQMLGSTRDELLGLPFAAFTHEDDLRDDAVHWQHLRDGEVDAYQREKRYIRKDGSVLWGLITVSALRDEAGQFLGSSAQVQDITAQKVAEAALREQEARLEALVEHLPIVLYNLPWGGSKTIRYVSPRFERETGLRREDLPVHFADILAQSHPDDRDLVRRVNERANRTGETFHLEYRLRGGDGAWRWMDHRSALMRDDAGRPLAWHGSILDISDRKRLEASLQASEEQFRFAFQDAAIGMAITGPDDTCLDANPAYCAIVGVRRDDLIGSSIIGVTHPADRATAADRLARVHRGELGPYQISKRYQRPDGTSIDGLLTVSAVRDATGTLRYCIGQLQDVTAQRATEAALRENEEILRSVIEQAPAAVYQLEPGPNGRFTYASPRFKALTGLSIAAGVLKLSDFFPRVHPDDIGRLRAADDQAASSGEGFDIEYRLRGAEGTWVWVHDRSTPARDADGAVIWHGVLIDISERKALEQALAEREERQRLLVEQLPVAVYSLEPPPGTHYTYVSPRFGALTGMSPADVARGTEAFFERVHPDDAKRVRAADRRSNETLGPHAVEFRMRGADGEWLWLQERAMLALDEQGAPLAWHGVLIDISEQRRLEEAVRENEARFRSTFEGAGIGMSLADMHGRFFDVNPAFCRFLGYTPEELRQHTYLDITHPDDRTMSLEYTRRLFQERLPGYSTEKRYVRADGRTVWGDLTITTVSDAGGTPTYEIAQVQDITARKEAEAALRESEARFRALVQHDPDVVVIMDLRMQVTYASPSIQEALGVSPEDVLGSVERGLDLVHPEDVEPVLALFGEVGVEPGRTRSIELRVNHVRHGWRWFQLTMANLIEDPGIAGFLINMRHITERKQAELATASAMQAQQAAIRELERLSQTKSRFLSTISHEFRTPLTAIIGYSEYLAADAASRMVADDAAVINREARRLNRMVDDVLLLDRVDGQHLTLTTGPVDLNTMARDVAETFRPLTDKHELVLRLDPDLPPVDGDADRLSQALTNLVSNAIKYSPDGGAVTISTERHGDEVIVAVHDEGIGISPRDRARIFERFERIESGIAGRIAGTGLGLSIVQEIAILHGGRVWLESELGSGSRFSLVVPIRSRRVGERRVMKKSRES